MKKVIQFMFCWGAPSVSCHVRFCCGKLCEHDVGNSIWRLQCASLHSMFPGNSLWYCHSSLPGPGMLFPKKNA